MNEVAKCRRAHNRLGFAYQIGFARLFNRFPAQQPLEINDELLSFVAVQMNIDSERISDYALWQHTVSEHQARIQQYLGLRPFDLDESNALERFTFEESCRLEQTAPLLARAQEFLKERRVVFPAESALLRLVGEQKKLADESIVTRIALAFCGRVTATRLIRQSTCSTKSLSGCRPTPRGNSMNRCANSARPSRWHSLRCGLWERSFSTMTLTT
jgi:Domain of unknown function (DUF4158)